MDAHTFPVGLKGKCQYMPLLKTVHLNLKGNWILTCQKQATVSDLPGMAEVPGPACDELIDEILLWFGQSLKRLCSKYCTVVLKSRQSHKFE